MARQFHREGDFEQPSLMGMDTPQPRERLFFALAPDAKTKTLVFELAQRLRGEHGLDSKLIAAERLHITLHHLGDYPELPQSVVDSALAAGAKVSMPPFELAFDRAGSFVGRPGKSPFVLRGGNGLAPLLVFHRALSNAMSLSGLGRWAGRSFNPHLTLFYNDRIIAEQPVETISWTAREFVLVHSLLGKTIHKQLASWSLNN